MTSDAATQLRRILDLLPRLADGEAHPVAEVAALAGVEPRALLADLTSLTDRFDAPGGFVDGVQVFVDADTVCVLSDHLRRPMRLTMAELCALELGLCVMRAERGPEEHGTLERARERLRAAITRLPSNDAHTGLRHAELPPVGDPVTLRTLREAIRERTKLQLDYRKGSSRDTERRIVCPWAIAVASGSWYLVACCERSAGMRFFRLDRVVGAERTAEGFEMPTGFSVDDVVENGRLLTSANGRTMTVRYGARIARWIAEREGRAPDADGSLTMEHPLLDEMWGIRHVLQYGPDAELLTPPELREAFVRRLDAMAS